VYAGYHKHARRIGLLVVYLPDSALYRLHDSSPSLDV
jgi:hypothetical protein